MITQRTTKKILLLLKNKDELHSLEPNQINHTLLILKYNLSDKNLNIKSMKKIQSKKYNDQIKGINFKLKYFCESKNR